MPSQLKDYTGLKMNYLTVVKRSKDHIRPNGKRSVRWVCKCVCGNKIERDSNDIGKWIKTGKGCKSCGCKTNEILAKYNTKHGHAGKQRTREYETFRSMHKRCYNKDNDSYNNYGGRGIKVCERWQKHNNGFENFLKDMGVKPKGLTLERINTDGNYEPDNCKWATPKEQLNNTRKTIMLEYNGIKLPLTVWAEHLNIKSDTLRCRSKEGWNKLDILLTPLNESKPKFYYHPHLVRLRQIVREAD